MGELKFIGKRVVYLAVMLFGVATLVFILNKDDTWRPGSCKPEPESFK